MLTDKERDAITEIVNIGVGKGSATLSDMIDSEVLLNVPYVNLIKFDEILDEFNKMSVRDVHAVEMKFIGEYEGLANIILSSESAHTLAGILTDSDSESDELYEMMDGIMIEVGNIILNAVMGSFGNILEVPFDYKIPQSFKGKISDLYASLDQEKFKQILVCRTNFTVKDRNISGEILIMYEINSFNKLKSILNKMME